MNMVRMSVLVAAAGIMMSGSVFAGQTQAERERALSKRGDPGIAVGLQVHPAQETGSLPTGVSRQMKSGGVSKPEGPAGEIRGRTYKVGIGTR